MEMYNLYTLALWKTEKYIIIEVIQNSKTGKSSGWRYIMVDNIH